MILRILPRGSLPRSTTASAARQSLDAKLAPRIAKTRASEQAPTAHLRISSFPLFIRNRDAVESNGSDPRSRSLERPFSFVASLGPNGSRRGRSGICSSSIPSRSSDAGGRSRKRSSHRAAALVRQPHAVFAIPISQSDRMVVLAPRIGIVLALRPGGSAAHRDRRTGPLKAIRQLFDIPGHLRLLSAAFVRLRRASRMVAILLARP